MELRVTAGNVHVAIKVSSIVFLVLFFYATSTRAVWEYPGYLRTIFVSRFCDITEHLNDHPLARFATQWR